MPLDHDELEVGFEGCPFGVSARRIYEHMTLGQINPFGRSVSSVRSQRDAAELIDLVCFDSLGYSLTGLTLAGLDDVALSARMLGDNASTARHGAAQRAVHAFVAVVEAAAKQHAVRRAARNVPSRFLPVAARSDPFGVPLLRSRLCEYLATQAPAKAGAAQWLGTIRNLTNKGLRNEELQRSGLIDFLERKDGDASPLTGKELAQAVDFSALSLSVIANITEARTQLRFEVVSDWPLAKIKGEAKPQAGQQRQLRLFDRVLGYPTLTSCTFAPMSASITRPRFGLSGRIGALFAFMGHRSPRTAEASPWRCCRTNPPACRVAPSGGKMTSMSWLRYSPLENFHYLLPLARSTFPLFRAARHYLQSCRSGVTHRTSCEMIGTATGGRSGRTSPN